MTLVDTGTAPPAIPPHAVANRRRSVLVAVPLAVVVMLLLSLAGHAVAGLLFAVGLAIGALNTWLVQRSVVRYAASSAPDAKRRFVGGVFGRLALISLVALGICLLFLPDGLGVLAGLAAFQVLMLAGASMPLIRELRSS